MKKAYLFIMLIAQLSQYCWGQNLSCGTESFMEDSVTTALLHHIRQLRSYNNDTLFFRVQIHIIRNSNHYTSLNIDSLKKDFQALNEYYKPAAIHFYMCNTYNYIDDDQYYDFYHSDEAYLRNTYNDPYAVNIYLANTVHSSSNVTVAGYSYYPSANRNFVVIDYHYLRKSTLIHEVGHFFNLLHTHDNTLGYELVNGSNCAVSGDLCCDTPADPMLSYANVNTNCEYTGTSIDANGDFYTPDPHNIMSYARKECRDSFSSEQYERIRDAAFLPNRQILCSHHTILENGAVTSDTTITNDYVIIDNYYMSADSIKIDACAEILLNSSVTLHKGVILQ